MPMEERVGTVMGYDEKTRRARIRLEEGAVSPGDTVLIKGRDRHDVEVREMALHTGGQGADRARPEEDLLLEVPERVAEGDQVVRVQDPYRPQHGEVLYRALDVDLGWDDER